MKKSLFFIPLILFGIYACTNSRPAKKPEKQSDKTVQTDKTVKNNNNAETEKDKMNKPEVVKTSLEAVGLDSKAMDKTVNPCDDFYEYACGGWIKNTEIPSDRVKWSRSFSEINKTNLEFLKNVLENSGKSKEPDMVKLHTMYSTCMNEAAIEKEGLNKIKPIFNKIKKIRSKKQLFNLISDFHKKGIWVIWDISPEQDGADASKTIAALDQNGLGLPDRDYYLKKDKKSVNIRAKYLKHIEKMLKFSGIKSRKARKAAKKILAIETKLAELSKSRVERRDPKGMYNKYDIEAMQKTAGYFPWKQYFKNMGLDPKAYFNVTAPKFFAGAALLLKKTKISDWKYYMRWHLLNTMAQYLPKKFADADFAMTQVLTGQDKQRPRWKRCISVVDGYLGELLAKPFVHQKFTPESKKKAELYVLTISKVFDRILDKLDWMDETTRKKAKEKLHNVAYLIGYPEKWKTYDFKLGKSFSENILNARTFKISYNLSKVGKPVNKKEWFMTPQTVNAYYSPHKNHMVFPAGILQPPFFNSKAGVAVNLGAMGMVVGHELTHGFDDQGSQFDSMGNLKNWWTKKVRSEFTKKTDCMVKQYGSYEVRPGVKLNGKLTLGENIADNGGIKLAYQAYKELRKNADKVYVADGFSEDQQFFLSVAQIWCSKYRDKFVEFAVKVDPHSHPHFRVNGSLSNFPEFAKAFQCKAGTKMNPEHQCKVW